MPDQTILAEAIARLELADLITVTESEGELLLAATPKFAAMIVARGLTLDDFYTL